MSNNWYVGKLPFYREKKYINLDFIINDEKELRITVHFADEGIDTGYII